MKQSPVRDSSTAPRSVRSYRGEAPEVRQQQRRERLIEAALDAFAEHGYTATTMRDICAGARLTERYFYESFKNTDEMFNAVFKHLVLQLRSELFNALSKAPMTIDGLAEAGLRAFFEFIKADPRRARILLVDAVRNNLSSRRMAEEAMAEYVTMLQGLAAQLYTELPSNVDPRLVTLGMVGMCIHLAMGWVRSDFKEPLEQVLEHCMYAWHGLNTWITTSATGKRKPVMPRGGDRRASGKAKAATELKDKAGAAKPAGRVRAKELATTAGGLRAKRG